MDRYISVIVEVALFIAVFAVASGLATPLRKRRSDATKPEIGGGRGPLAMLGSIATPLFVIAISYGVIQLIANHPQGPRWLAESSAHLRAWKLFWGCLLGIDLIEGLLQQYCSLRHRSFPLPDLLAAIVRALLILCAAFLALHIEMGINLAPLLASTALLTAVIGFALQGVLGNLMAGMSLHLVRTIIPNDWLSIGGIEGRVIRTNWRETRLLTTDGANMIVPNSKVASELIHNMSRPTPRRRHHVNVMASADNSPDSVIAALVEAAAGVPDVLKYPAPEAFVTEYQEYGLRYTLVFWSNRYYDHLPIEGDVGRLIWYKFRRRGIEIPFPMSGKLMREFLAAAASRAGDVEGEGSLGENARDLIDSDFHKVFCADGDGRALLSHSDYGRLAPLLSRRLYTRGETLYRQGEPGDSFHVLVRGGLKGSIRQESGGPPVEFRLSPGAVLGEMSMITGLPRTATILVDEESELLEFDEASFRRLLALNDGIPDKLAQLSAERAERNKASFEELAELSSVEVKSKIQHASIMKRFLKMLGAGD